MLWFYLTTFDLGHWDVPRPREENPWKFCSFIHRTANHPRLAARTIGMAIIEFVFAHIANVVAAASRDGSRSACTGSLPNSVAGRD
jgi:hypothetical protein